MLKGDIAGARGKALLVETSAAGWGEGRASAPQRDWMASRLGPMPPPGMVEVAQQAFEHVLASPTFDNSSRRVVAECYQPGVSVSVVGASGGSAHTGWPPPAGFLLETLGSCVRHLVTDHLKTGADRRWLISLFFPNHRTTINDRRKFRFLVRRWQKSNGFPRQTTTARQLARIETVSPCNTRHRSTGFHRLGHNPRLQLIRPAAPTSRHRKTSTLLRFSVEGSMEKLRNNLSHRMESQIGSPSGRCPSRISLTMRTPPQRIICGDCGSQ